MFHLRLFKFKSIIIFSPVSQAVVRPVPPGPTPTSYSDFLSNLNMCASYRSGGMDLTSGQVKYLLFFPLTGFVAKLALFSI